MQLAGPGYSSSDCHAFEMEGSECVSQPDNERLTIKDIAGQGLIMAGWPGKAAGSAGP